MAGQPSGYNNGTENTETTKEKFDWGHLWFKTENWIRFFSGCILGGLIVFAVFKLTPSFQSPVRQKIASMVDACTLSYKGGERCMMKGGDVDISILIHDGTIAPSKVSTPE